MSLEVLPMDITLEDRLNALQQISQRKLIEILNSIPGTKDLIIEFKLMKILDSFIGVSTLKKYGVDKIYKLEQGLKPSNAQRIFLVPCNLAVCKTVLDQIHSELARYSKLSLTPGQPCHHLLVAPMLPTILSNIAEEEGLTGLITLRSMSWEFIKFDGNVLSLEFPFFTDLYYFKDTSHLPALARSIWTLKMVLGQAKMTLSFGKHCQQVLKMVESLKATLGSPPVDHEIGAFIIMDRNYDLASTLLTPVTYTGLLSEVVELNAGIAMLSTSQTKLDPEIDQVYGEARDKPLSEAMPALCEKAKSLKSEQDSIQSMKIAEMQSYVSTKLMKSREITKQLAFHISACENIANTLGAEFRTLQLTEKSILESSRREECLYSIEKNIDDHPLRSLRLLALMSITSDGVSLAEVQNIQKSHLHAHGYQNIPLFYKMENVGLLKYRTDNVLYKLPNWTSQWMSTAQRLKQLPGQIKGSNFKASICPSYVFSGAYIPAVAQFLSIVANHDKDSKAFEDLLNLQQCKMSGQRGSLTSKTVVICVVGGITYGEIAACRLVEKTTGIRLVLISDSITNGNKLIQTLQQV